MGNRAKQAVEASTRDLGSSQRRCQGIHNNRRERGRLKCSRYLKGHRRNK